MEFGKYNPKCQPESYYQKPKTSHNILIECFEIFYNANNFIDNLKVC